MDKKLQKGIVAVLIANLVNVVFSLATNFLLPKYLSIESYAGIKEFQLYVSYVGLFHLGFVDGIYLKYGGKTLGKDVDKEFSTDLSTDVHFSNSYYHRNLDSCDNTQRSYSGLFCNFYSATEYEQLFQVLVSGNRRV